MKHLYNIPEEEMTELHALHLGLLLGEPRPTQCQTAAQLRGRRIVGVYGPWDDHADEERMEESECQPAELQ